MHKIYSKLFDFLEIGDDFPTVIMGVLNLSPESFYKESVYNEESIYDSALEMVKNGAKMLDLGARSTAPWSDKISVKEEIKRILPSMELICKKVPDNIIISVDTQYKEVARPCFEIATKYKKKLIINDVSCLKTDLSLENFVIENKIPIILMASKKIPGDLCTIEKIIEQLRITVKKLNKKGYEKYNLILDPGIGRWTEKKTHIYDLKIIHNLNRLRILKCPILIAVSRKSFIGNTLNITDPKNRYNGTLSATAVAVFNGANIVRTHDVNQQLLEIVKMAEEIRRSK